MIHVCSLAALPETVSAVAPSHLVTLINSDTVIERPAAIKAANHLKIGINDICAPADGYVCASETHIGELIGFLRGWDRERPILIHCWAGISRSTAAAYITACIHHPEHDERAIARALRAASPTATPNALIVALADQALGRGGRMAAAIEEIGRGENAAAGLPFRLDI